LVVEEWLGNETNKPQEAPTEQRPPQARPAVRQRRMAPAHRSVPLSAAKPMT
jgi:hypothetical protein